MAIVQRISELFIRKKANRTLLESYKKIFFGNIYVYIDDILSGQTFQ